MEQMKHFGIDEIPGAAQAGLEWMICCGVQDKNEALRLAEVAIADEQLMEAELRLLRDSA